ncbi:LamB/YcsF family protein [Paenarthrobacter ureafaciens]|uniref:LamB/YcsF family protein n=1 Tax=Paenarthrobacter ureafaciens TaxID=37931 RepID=UPI001FB447A9|nr:5-oxoprolinase subunit PxpA [Paenarthrobacter ureafaciens]UOD81373.1 LamB/YcsF family protein [Paenarthrobacter ureafaciens]WNZ04026.1 LamB/YcsF family protein [Paenarthrobacter ureafaciens]
MAIIDLNSDVGEAFGRWTLGDDEAIFRSVSSANVACGFHAGDPGVIRATCEKAVEAGVVIGAHVGYRDLAGFGRRFLDIDPKELADDVVYQIGALQALAAVSGGRVEYVKPHGGLYNTIVKHTAQARAVVEAVKSVDPNLPILGLPGSEVLRLAEEAGLRAVSEAFADRAYNPDGTLVSRSQPGAVLHDPVEVAEHVLRMTTEQSVRTIDGSVLTIRAESICVHGDSPGAVAMATEVKSALIDAGVSIGSFL